MLKVNSLKLVLIFCSFVIFSVSWADPKNNPYNDPNKGSKDGKGYGFKDDARPWFDGKDYPFYRDMYDGKSIKAQEEGTYQNFPTQSVPVSFQLGKIKKIYEPLVPIAERSVSPVNPHPATPESIARGQVLYETYCAVCHGKTGNAESPVAEKAKKYSWIITPISALLPVLSESHLYNKIRYGSAYNLGDTYQLIPRTMPAYGMQTSSKDRWDIVNYMKSQRFGKKD